jgi:hypothetical protein
MNRDAIAMPVHPSAFMSGGYIWKPMRRFDCELLEYFHHVSLRNAQKFVNLKTQAPLRMVEAIPHSKFSVGSAARAVHWLKKEMAERKRLEVSGIGADLRVDQLQFVAAMLNKLRAGLRAYTKPIHTRWSRNSPVGFDSNLKSPRMKRGNEAFIQLQEWLSAGADYEPLFVRGRTGPLFFHRGCTFFGGCELTAPGPIDSHKVGVAKLTRCRRSVCFTTRPEVAAGESAEYGWPARVCSLALQGVKNLFD